MQVDLLPLKKNCYEIPLSYNLSIFKAKILNPRRLSSMIYAVQVVILGLNDNFAVLQRLMVIAKIKAT